MYRQYQKNGLIKKVLVCNIYIKKDNNIILKSVSKEGSNLKVSIIVSIENRKK